MQKLIEILQLKISSLKNKSKEIDLENVLLNDLCSVFPFNKFEYIISHLIAKKTINIKEYLEIRNAYLKRNKYLYLFEMTAPRTFGETWAQGHLNKIIPELKQPSVNYDENYSAGQYDFWFDGIRIEVKASRAVKRKSGDSLIAKALSSNSKEGFDMNFQQIKPACCDVFIWIAVWRDKIRYFVLSSSEVEHNKYYSQGQHRGNVGEGQLWIKESNIAEFSCYEVNRNEIFSKIVEKGKKQKQLIKPSQQQMNGLQKRANLKLKKKNIKNPRST